MARKTRSKPELRPVDEAAEEVERFFRLDPDAGDAPVAKEVVKLSRPAAPEMKLEVARRDEVETRSQEPGVEALMEQDRTGLELTETEWGAAATDRRPVPWGWFVLLGLLLVGGALWSLMRVRDAGEQLEVIRLETREILASEEESESAARQLIEAIEASVFAFSAAADVEAMAAFVRHPERVRPLMDDHYARHPFAPPTRPVIEVLQPLTLDLRADFWLASLAMPSGDKRNLLIEVPDADNVRIDWETAVCYQPIDWDEFAVTRPGGTTFDFRVYVEPDLFFSHEFTDTNQWHCYRLTALNSDETLFGYARADSETGRQLRERFTSQGPRKTAMVLRLSLPIGLTSRRGVVIDRVLAERWIHLDPPDGGS